MLSKPFYDPHKTYEDNFTNGPFGAFADGEIFQQNEEPTYEVFGNKVFLPFGIAPGPLLNGKYVRAALDKGFDIAVYKTVRTRKYPCSQFPNVLAVHTDGDLTIEQANIGLVADSHYKEPLSITNSFGVPSFDPDFWQKDLADTVKYAKKGQIVIGGFQGTTGGGESEYIQDFITAARLVKETKVSILEVNLSCPNEGTAHLLCFDTARTQNIIESIKNEIGNTPLIMKIAYFAEDEQLRDLIKRVGKIIDGISAINTIPAKIYNKKKEQALPGNGRLISGACGKPIKWAGISMVERLKKLKEDNSYTFNIIGVGGVTNVEDYNEYRKAGADEVMCATGAMWNPYLAQDIKKAIKPN